MLQLRQVLNSNRPGLFQKLGLTSPHNKVLASLLQTGTDYVRDSEPASGAIFGILKQMKEEFESNAVKAKTDEETAQETFNEMKTAKTQEIAAGNEQVGNKQTELANANEDNAQSKEDLEDTTEQLSADRTFLADVKSRCETMDKEWSVRTKVRQEEVTAVGEALEILTDDDARSHVQDQHLPADVTDVDRIRRKGPGYILHQGCCKTVAEPSVVLISRWHEERRCVHKSEGIHRCNGKAAEEGAEGRSREEGLVP